MIDPHLLRHDLPAVADNLARRGYAVDAARLAECEERRKAAQQETERLRAERNEKSRAIAEAKKSGGDADALAAAVGDINARLKTAEESLRAAREEWQQMALDMPNLLRDSVPNGRDAADNREERRWGEPPIFAFSPKDHAALGEGLGMMDFALAAKLAAARFVALSGELARMHRALIQMMMDMHVNEHGYLEAHMPYLANAATLTGTGQLPKFGDDLFFAERDELYLIPTAEVVVTNIVRDEIVAADRLPMKYVCHTPCFRREAGSYGRDTRGMLRQHQFDKVELAHITAPVDSAAALEEMTAAAEAVLRRLGLPHRVVSLCGGDIGFAAAQTYDIEVWLPGQSAYREISSCSNCDAFQARRMRARYRGADGKPAHLHTLNGSGVAVGRALIAVMENCQQADGGVIIPEALRSYMGGLERIAPPG